MRHPRVVVVEDDPAILAWIAMALEDMPIELLSCTTRVAALHTLRQAPAQLLLTDLMLPDGNGLDMLSELHRWPVQQQPKHVVVMSATDAPPVHSALEAAGVDEFLAKPASLAALTACVARYTQGPPALEGTVAVAEEDSAVRGFFGGDRPLFEAYRVQCLAQFQHDIPAGDLALGQADWDSLHRLVHSLKTVLLMLGLPVASERARALERQLAVLQPAHPTPDIAAAWQRLREDVLALRA